ncbi:hypothetical protein E4O92_12450 [Massilia horti]|uniref:RHS repeat protein n=1 Tax=Massilia horti TaxID=2562153 RepID=A0A4Y9T1M5_9BURK|nr:hypothetical protein E4O92_12450 [Massilia horti]
MRSLPGPALQRSGNLPDLAKGRYTAAPDDARVTQSLLQRRFRYDCFGRLLAETRPGAGRTRKGHQAGRFQFHLPREGVVDHQD